MSKMEFIRPWPGLPTVPDEASIPIPLESLSDAERRTLQEVADTVVLDQTQPTPLPVFKDLFIAEPQHPAVVEPTL